MESIDCCVCSDEQCRLDVFEVSKIGCYAIGSSVCRFVLARCTQCGKPWMRASVEDDSSPSWSRWYRAAVTLDAADEMTVDRALEVLAGASWHFYGGAYYRTSGERCSGPVPTLMGPLAAAA